MNTTGRLKTADKVKAAFGVWKKAAIAEHLGMTYPTLRARLKDNSFQDAELERLKLLGII